MSQTSNQTNPQTNPKNITLTNKPLTYADSGVNISNGAEAVQRIKTAVKSTYSKSVITTLGSFGSALSLKDVLKDYKDPILVQSTDGVGTKLIIAKAMNNFEGVGKDVVSNNVNDMLCMGAKPLTFLDYVGCSSLLPEQMEIIVTGMANECREYGISLVGGEMAEMPGVYVSGEVDVVGFVTGVVERDGIIDGLSIVSGDIVLGLKSSGLHTNGFSLARKALFEIANAKPETSFGTICLRYNINPEGDSEQRIGDVLLEPHRNYTTPIHKLIKAGVKIKGLSHITGGGFVENIPRIMPPGLGAKINTKSYEIPPIFQLIQKIANMEQTEIYRTLNMGIGMVIVVDEKDKLKAFEVLAKIQDQELVELGVVNSKDGVKLL
jgi:phosphoribosylformylglycinamidine cyclo-ligase